MRGSIAAVAAVLAVACGRGAEKPAPVAPLQDVAGSVAHARDLFNAHRGEARFLALLSPT